MPVCQEDIRNRKLHPRFGVGQGVKSDGSVKVSKSIIVYASASSVFASVQVRAVDHFSWVPTSNRKRGRDKETRRIGSTNGCASVCEKLKHDHLDDLLSAVCVFLSVTAAIPGWFLCFRLGFVVACVFVSGLFKVDVNAAYSRVPIAPDHRWAAGVVYRFKSWSWHLFITLCPLGLLRLCTNGKNRAVCF